MSERASFTLFIQIIVIAAVAAGAGTLLSIPLSEMFIAAGLVIVLHKKQKRWLTIHTPPWLLLFVQVVLGISVGATISLSELGTTLTLPVIVGLVCCLTLQIISSYLWLTKKEGWTPFESLLGAVPGAMAAILVISESSEKPSAKVVYSHSVRLMILTLLALLISNSAPDSASVDGSLTVYAWLIFLALALMSLLLGKASTLLGIPAPYMLAALLITASFNGFATGIDMQLPKWMVIFATALLGILIGSRIADTTLREAMAYSRAGVMVTMIGLLVAVGVSGVFSILIDKSWVVLLLSWVPGSVEAMTAVALLLGMEPAFVMINHALRLLLLYSLPAMLKKQLEELRGR
ncbi:AbrB family transcriptional regulator [Vibrio cholerae]|uniref:AbrB family transcriptional regulator n=1 Tax=Vibrio cholerae TaxID=666 RepID=UPI000D349098|nr:AbrB family transcriptional regulator [Vibrio cholerae]EII3728081.1 AbrB family transcriptional regulator [Vibrio cholerae]KAA1202474.1 AbrB family transcriptional regulator [Vibrio cholerae]KAA1210955.1 AbrB family transcriptional regulator [Vibrio cholerae]KAA1225104.1 AbrB family transcriptional regulator [Vibrio cholerae]TYW38468.1 AbrB family transcriptional regulator [Vibrio cholerae]